MRRLHMVSIPLDLRALRRLSADHGLAGDEGRALHHFVGETFGKGAIQPFRLLPGRNGANVASLYGYTALGLEELRANLDIAAPEFASLLHTAHLAVKPMPDNWTHGRRLAFDVRVRPVRRLKKPLEGWSREVRREALRGRPSAPIKEGSEIDAFVVERLRKFPAGPPELAAGVMARPREDVYRAWLAERLEAAAVIDDRITRLIRFERSTVLRQGSRPIEGPDATFHGELNVTDGAMFAALLAKGVGRHTAYGYGMLLLRPARW